MKGFTSILLRTSAFYTGQPFLLRYNAIRCISIDKVITLEKLRITRRIYVPIGIIFVSLLISSFFLFNSTRMDFNFAFQQRELPNETSNFKRITRLRFY